MMGKAAASLKQKLKYNQDFPGCFYNLWMCLLALNLSGFIFAQTHNENIQRLSFNCSGTQFKHDLFQHS